jgi:RHS repeat-associated protein
MYDPRDQLIRRTWEGGAVDPASVAFSYNPRGERTELSRYSDASTTQLVGRTTFEYDALGRKTRISHLDALSAVLARYDYAFDLASQLVSQTHHGSTSNYSYDQLGQLTSATHGNQPDESYLYDANGNRIHGQNTVGPNNRIVSDGQFDYVYDNEGNLTRKTDTITGDFTTYAYDHRNRLTDLRQHDAGGTVLSEARYTYDMFDRRIAKVVDGHATNFVYDGEHMWADFDQAGNVMARYLFGDDTDELLARHRPGEGTAWYLTDKLGTVRDIINAAGLPIDQIAYDSFGNVLSESNPAAGDRYKFTGRELDAESGLYYYRARHYNPQLGRFQSEDPLVFGAGDPNLYRYVFNSPTNFTDPTGQASVVETVNKIGSGPVGTILINARFTCITRELFGFAVAKEIFGGPITQADAVTLGLGVLSCAFFAPSEAAEATFLLLTETLYFATMGGSATDIAVSVLTHSIGIAGGSGISRHFARARVVRLVDDVPPVRSIGRFDPPPPPRGARLKNPGTTTPSKPRHGACFVAGTLVWMGGSEQANLGSYEFSWNGKIWLAAAALLTGVAGAQVIRSRRRNGRPREELVDNAMANFQRDEIDDGLPGPLVPIVPEAFQHRQNAAGHGDHELGWSAPGLSGATESEMASPSSTATLEQTSAVRSALDRHVSRAAEFSYKPAEFGQPAARPSRSSWRNLLAAAWLLACLTLAAYFGVAGLADQGRSRPSHVDVSARLLTKPIEEIRVGDRVLGLNPELDQSVRSTPDPDPATWRTVRLRMPKQSGELLPIELLRPRSWVASNGALEGGEIDLDLPELGAVGKARVLSVGPCPDIKPGAGRVVTGTFAHPPSERIIDVCLAESDVPISCTENHLFWSEDRGQFVPGRQLEAGEQVRTADGCTSAITSITDHPASRRVYNLEVHVEHVYLVSTLGVLVHNQCETDPLAAREGRVSLDTNAIISLLEGAPADVQAVLKAIGGRNTSVSITAVKEFLQGRGDINALRSLLKNIGGTVGKAPSAQTVEQLQKLGLKSADARIVGSAVEEGIGILTRDKQILKKVPGVAEGF